MECSERGLQNLVPLGLSPGPVGAGANGHLADKDLHCSGVEVSADAEYCQRVTERLDEPLDSRQYLLLWLAAASAHRCDEAGKRCTLVCGELRGPVVSGQIEWRPPAGRHTLGLHWRLRDHGRASRSCSSRRSSSRRRPRTRSAVSRPLRRMYSLVVSSERWPAYCAIAWRSSPARTRSVRRG